MHESKIKYTSGDLKDHEGVAAIIKNKAGNILMQEHIKFGFWTIPVGKVEPGQTLLEALRQEMFEECGINIGQANELGVKNVEHVRDGKKVHVRLSLYEIRRYTGTIKNKEPHKHTQQLFIPLDKITKLPYLSDSTVFYLETLGTLREAKLL